MTTYRLQDAGYSTFKKIVTDGKWVGRVCVHADGGYLGIIGPVTIKARTEREAFDEVVARDLGFASAAALAVHNARVRATNRIRRAHVAAVVDQALNHRNFEPFMDMLNKLGKE